MADLKVVHSVETKGASLVALTVVQLGVHLVGRLADMTGVKSADQKDIWSAMNLVVPRVVHWAEKTAVYSVARMVGQTEAY